MNTVLRDTSILSVLLFVGSKVSKVLVHVSVGELQWVFLLFGGYSLVEQRNERICTVTGYQHIIIAVFMDNR